MEAMNEPERPRAEGAPKGIYGPDGEPQFFSEPGLDRMMAVIMNLAGEVWVQEERLLALEEVKGRIPVDRDAHNKAFIERIFEPLRKA
jgi:hypothetical protein